MPGHSLTSPQARNLRRSLQGGTATHTVKKTVGHVHFKTPQVHYDTMLITFRSKVWLKRLLFFEIFEDLDNAVAFSDGISVTEQKSEAVHFLNKEVYSGDVSHLFPTAYLLRWVMSPDKLLRRTEALVPQSHCSIDDILSIPAHHNKPGAHKNTYSEDQSSCKDTYSLRNEK